MEGLTRSDEQSCDIKRMSSDERVVTNGQQLPSRSLLRVGRSLGLSVNPTLSLFFLAPTNCAYLLFPSLPPSSERRIHSIPVRFHPFARRPRLLRPSEPPSGPAMPPYPQSFTPLSSPQLLFFFSLFIVNLSIVQPLLLLLHFPPPD